MSKTQLRNTDTGELIVRLINLNNRCHHNVNHGRGIKALDAEMQEILTELIKRGVLTEAQRDTINKPE